VTLRRSQPWPHEPGVGALSLKDWGMVRLSWLDVAWILTGTVVMAAAAGMIFLLGAELFGLL
jgi:hypothetical protein